MQKKKPKILFIMQLPPPVHGASLINQYIYNSELINDTFNTKTIALNFVSRINQIGKFSFTKLIKMIILFREIKKGIRSFKPDLVYYTLSPVGGAFYRDVLYIWLIKLLKVKIVFHLHGKGIKKTIQSNKIKTFIYNYTFNQTNVICLAKTLAQDIEDVYNDKPFILWNGIPENNQLRQTHLKQDYISLLYLSNLVRTKGIYIFIEALKILDKEGYNFQANIIGNETADISIKGLKKQIEDAGLLHKINILGAKYGDEKYSYLSTADIFVFPTFYKNECFPLVILEALQFGLPVISTYEGAISEIVSKDVGILTQQQSVSELVDAIRLLITNKEQRGRLSENARSRYESHYTLEKFEMDLSNILKACL